MSDPYSAIRDQMDDHECEDGGRIADLESEIERLLAVNRSLKAELAATAKLAETCREARIESMKCVAKLILLNHVDVKANVNLLAMQYVKEALRDLENAKADPRISGGEVMDTEELHEKSTKDCYIHCVHAGRHVSNPTQSRIADLERRLAVQIEISDALRRERDEWRERAKRWESTSYDYGYAGQG